MSPLTGGPVLPYRSGPADNRPADPELAIRAAKLAWQALGELRRAKDLAAHAVELAPENGGYRRLLGLVYKEAGLTANAKR